MEQTLLVLKPDATMRRGVGAAVFEQILISLPDVKFKGFLEIAVPRHLAEKHYAIHEEKFFYPWLLQFIQVGNVTATVLEGEDIGPSLQEDARPEEEMEVPIEEVEKTELGESGEEEAFSVSVDGGTDSVLDAVEE